MLPGVNNMLPWQRQILARFAVSALVASLPLLYVSMLRPPPAALAGDTAFWFLMSNCVIAAIVAADDAGTLFFGSSKPDSSCCHEDNLSYYVPGGGQQAVGNGAVVPFVASELAVNAEGARIHQEVLARTVYSPFLIQGEEGNVDPTTKSSADLKHASVLRRGQDDEEPSTDKNSNVTLQGQEDAASTTLCTDEPAIVVKADGALAGPEPEPWPSLETGMGLEEEEIPEAWAIAQHYRTPDLQQGKGAVAGGEGKLRRSATEGSKPAAAEESEYWELSDEELNSNVTLQGQEDAASTTLSTDEPAIVVKADGGLAGPEPEPWPSLETGMGIEEEEIPEAWAIAQHYRTPDLQQGKGAVAGGEGKLRRSATGGSKSAAAEESEYWELSDEELNSRVEEFIARFNREMRRQIEQEAGV